MQESYELKGFTLVTVLLCVAAYFISPYPQLAMWFGFAIAGYSVIANDSIQTLGTFLSCNNDKPWQFLLAISGGTLMLFLVAGWYLHNGDLAFGRLTLIEQPMRFDWLDLMAPIALLVLTRLRFPVSTSFLVLSIFSSQVVIQEMLIKSALGYVIAFATAFLLWAVVKTVIRFESDTNYNKKMWWWFQLAATIFLWGSWMMHDIANVAVFLPRQLSFNMMVGVVAYLFFIMGVIMYRRGGNMQEIVTEKTNVNDVRVTTIIDICYAVVLIFFKEINTIPMSTTWVFLGILGGRELALAYYNNKYQHDKAHALRLIRSDIFRATIGLTVSLIIILFVVNF